VRLILTIIALLFAAVGPAAALDFPQRDGRVIDEARLLDEPRKRVLENELANLEAQTSKQVLVVTLASARGMAVDDYGLELRKHWGLEANGQRVMLIVVGRDGRSVLQFDSSLRDVLGGPVTDNILNKVMVPKFNSGDFPGGVMAATEAIIGVLNRSASPSTPPAPLRLAQNDITVPATSEFPALSGRVVDAAGELDAGTRESLRAKLAAHEARTSNQIVVATVKSLNGNSIEEYANRLFRRWQLGQKGKNNGVLLLHAPAERKIRIEVGYGLEGTLTDAITKFIIANSITPRFKANDFSGGMTRGVDDIIKVLSGDEEFKQRAAAPERHWLSDVPPFVFILMAVVLFIIIRSILSAGTPAKRGRHSGFWSSGDWSTSSSGGSSSSWGSSSSGSSDSFSGGGGDSGGGGSSGDY
jgi:uncharacterized protein